MAQVATEAPPVNPESQARLQQLMRDVEAAGHSSHIGGLPGDNKLNSSGAKLVWLTSQLQAQQLQVQTLTDHINRLNTALSTQASQTRSLELRLAQLEHERAVAGTSCLSDNSLSAQPPLLSEQSSSQSRGQSGSQIEPSLHTGGAPAESAGPTAQATIGMSPVTTSMVNKFASARVRDVSTGGSPNLCSDRINDKPRLSSSSDSCNQYVRSSAQVNMPPAASSSGSQSLQMSPAPEAVRSNYIPQAAPPVGMSPVQAHMQIGQTHMQLAPTQMTGQRAQPAIMPMSSPQMGMPMNHAHMQMSQPQMAMSSPQMAMSSPQMTMSSSQMMMSMPMGQPPMQLQSMGQQTMPMGMQMPMGQHQMQLGQPHMLMNQPQMQMAPMMPVGSPLGMLAGTVGNHVTYTPSGLNTLKRAADIAMNGENAGNGSDLNMMSPSTNKQFRSAMNGNQASTACGWEAGRRMS